MRFRRPLIRPIHDRRRILALSPGNAPTWSIAGMTSFRRTVITSIAAKVRAIRPSDSSRSRSEIELFAVLSAEHVGLVLTGASCFRAFRDVSSDARALGGLRNGVDDLNG